MPRRRFLACALYTACMLAAAGAGAQSHDSDRYALAGAPPGGPSPKPLRPADATPPAVDSAHANATSPVPVPRARAAGSLPAALQYNGAPIPALCFTQIWEQEGDNIAIDLTACNNPALKPVADDKYSASPGAYGAAYRPADAPAGDMSADSYIEYKYLGYAGADHAVLLSESGGGTGMFTSLYLLRRDGDMLKITRTAASGDRCNNGIAAAAIDDGALTYEINLTPASLYALASGAAHDDPALRDCAVCCYATASYRGDALDHITFAPALAASLSGDGDNGTGCFDDIVSRFVKSGEKKLPPARMKDFAATVYNSCLSDSAAAER